MMTSDKKTELKNKILTGLDKAYEKLLEFKKEKKSDLVIMRDKKIVKVKL